MSHRRLRLFHRAWGAEESNKMHDKHESKGEWNDGGAKWSMNEMKLQHGGRDYNNNLLNVKYHLLYEQMTNKSKDFRIKIYAVSKNIRNCNRYVFFIEY